MSEFPLTVLLNLSVTFHWYWQISQYSLKSGRGAWEEMGSALGTHAEPACARCPNPTVL